MHTPTKRYYTSPAENICVYRRTPCSSLYKSTKSVLRRVCVKRLKHSCVTGVDGQRDVTDGRLFLVFRVRIRLINSGSYDRFVTPYRSPVSLGVTEVGDSIAFWIYFKNRVQR